MSYASFADIGAVTAYACLALAGVSIIIMGLWGLYHGVEACIRLYFFYMVVCLLVEASYLLHHFLYYSGCDQMPSI